MISNLGLVLLLNSVGKSFSLVLLVFDRFLAIHELNSYLLMQRSAVKHKLNYEASKMRVLLTKN